jgi:23S rRNA pseudouridine955/2504/2580 synthase
VDEHSDGQRLDNFLLTQLKGVPRSYVYRLLRSGQVRVNKGRKKPGYRVCTGDAVRIPPVRSAQRERPAIPAAVAATLNRSILYEDGNVMILNKPSGLAVHGGSELPYGVIDVLRVMRPDAYLELVHRLDRDTSGCLAIALNRATLLALHAALQPGADKSVEKTYTALVAGHWRQGSTTIRAPLLKITRSGERMSVVDEQGQPAVSHFRVLQSFGSKSRPDDIRATLMEVSIETGRTHQIRVHAAHAGHPLAGDTKYGDPAFNRAMKAAGLSRLFLHATQLRLPLEPIVDVHAPMQDELSDILSKLGA